MNTKQFTRRLAHTLGTSERQAHETLRIVADLIGSAIVMEGELHLAGIGKFTVVERKARPGRNPKTGEPIEIPAHRGVKFTVAAVIKDALKNS